MARKVKDLTDKFTISRGIAGLVGAFCPYPVIGDFSLAYFLYPFIKNTSLGKSKVAGYALLTTMSVIGRSKIYRDYYQSLF